MIAYVSLEYSTDGPTPSDIDRVLAEAGLRRHGTYYSMEVADEELLGPALDRLHLALQGSGVRYRLHMNRPEMEQYSAEAIPSNPSQAGSRASNLGTGANGIRHGLSGGVRATENGGHEEAMARIASFLRTTGGSTLHDIMKVCSMDEDELEGILDHMVEEGRVTAHFQGSCVLYHHSGPMLRSLCR